MGSMTELMARLLLDPRVGGSNLGDTKNFKCDLLNGPKRQVVHSNKEPWCPTKNNGFV
jgi:hypothetical protein